MKLEVTWLYICMGEDYHAYANDAPLCEKRLPPAHTLRNFVVPPQKDNCEKYCWECMEVAYPKNNQNTNWDF